VTTQPIADLFDRKCCELVPTDTASEELDRVSAEFLDALVEAGLGGGTVLELGSGPGQFSRAFVRRGAAAVDGIDLSPESVAYAIRRADEEGLADRLSYRVGDAAIDPLSAHDAVVSKKVFCCYPDADRLLANTLPAARHVYGLVLPESRGAAGVIARTAIAAENTWRRLTGDEFRAYVHRVDRIIGAIEDGGFRLRASRKIGGFDRWRAFAFSRS
jgi:SAM-dependent methyltransferase